MIRGRLGSGRWEIVYPGVYRFAGAERSWRQLVLAACFSAGPRAAASHVTAGVLWDLIDHKHALVHVTVPFACDPRPLGFVVHRTRLPFTTRYRGAVPVTSAERTLIDLSGVVAERDLEEALDTALRRGLLTPAGLSVCLAQLGAAGLKGIGTLRQLVAVRAGRTRHPESAFETRVLRILADAGLPVPHLQYEVRRDGHLVGRVDLCYPDERVFIELEGWNYHSSRQAFDRAFVRRNLIVELGYVPLSFTWSDLRRPPYVAGTVRRVLAERGHPEVVRL